MKLDREQADIVMTALQNHRAELYIDGSKSEEMEKVSKIILTIEEEMEAKRLDQQKIMINEQKVKDFNDKSKIVDTNFTGVGSETGIEEDYRQQDKPGCEVCDD